MGKVLQFRQDHVMVDAICAICGRTWAYYPTVMDYNRYYKNTTKRCTQCGTLTINFKKRDYQ